MALLFDIGIIIILATVLAYFARVFKQPLILAYIITGVVVGPSVLNLISSFDETYIFAQLGVVFLLFLVGLNLNMGVLKEVGKISLITGIGQVFFTTVIGYFIAIALGLQPVEALYLSIALAFSSTIIIVKLLSDKNDLDSLYGKISVGFLIVQDFIAIIILVILSGLGTASLEFLLLTDIAKIALLFCIVIIFSRYVLPHFMDRVAGNTELLFLSGISWLMIMTLLSGYMGFSIEIGALLAGMSLAPLPYTYEIGGRIKSLRDFFLIFFFIILGSQMEVTLISSLAIPVIIFSVFVLIGNPLIVMALMGYFGYRKRTSLFAGLTVAQISEFSLILVALGFSLGHIGAEIVSMVTMVGVVTIVLSSYMIIYNSKIYNKISPLLGIFERKNLKEDTLRAKAEKYDIVLIGYHRIGFSIMRNIKNKEDVIVADFNPSIIKELKSKGFNHIYGDVSDPEIIDRLVSFRPKLLVSTIPDFEDNMILVKKFKQKSRQTLIFVTANNAQKALELYNLGVDYVIFPHFLGGEKAQSLINEFLNKEIGYLHRQRDIHIQQLKKYAGFGQLHI